MSDMAHHQDDRPDDQMGGGDFDAGGVGARSASGVWLAVAGLVMLQALVVSWFVWDFETVLATGREIVLDVQPVDPRSLFRGDYVVLRFEGLSRLEIPFSERGNATEIDGFSKLRSGDGLGMIVTRGSSGEGWVRSGSSIKCRNNLSVFESDVCLMGTISRISSGRGRHLVSVRFGIENYFVPEGEGRKLENAIRIQKLQVVVAVDETGRGLIKGLVVDGKRIGREGLF